MRNVILLKKLIISSSLIFLFLSIKLLIAHTDLFICCNTIISLFIVVLFCDVILLFLILVLVSVLFSFVLAEVLTDLIIEHIKMLS